LNNFIKYFLISSCLFLLSLTSFAQTLEEVTVTAARQEQSVQDVAISVQAITSDELQDQHIETADDLASTIPGFDFTEALGGGVVLKVRGLTVATIGSATTAPVITAQNGHQIGNRAFATMGFFDAERIELLEGPQGTLYGRNASAGLINFITAKPGADQFVTLTAGADGLTQLKFARDIQLSDRAVMRVAGTKLDIDPVIFNAGTGNDIDDRDSFGFRTTIEAEIDDQNTLTLQLEKLNVNDQRQNYGLSACNRDPFFGCDPLTEDFSVHLNRATVSSGTIANQFNLLTNINHSGADLYASTEATRINSIDVINKDVDPVRKDEFDMIALTNVTELDNMTITLKGTHIQQSYYHLTDNDHSNASDPLNGALMPSLVIPSLRTFCLGTLTNVTTDRAFECTDLSNLSQQFEINFVSDFDGPFNFTAGAYNYMDTVYSAYTIQTTAYALLNDFDQHPYLTMFGTAAPTMATYGGQEFYKIFGGALASTAIVDTNGNTLNEAVAAVAAAGGNAQAQALATVTFLQNTMAPAIALECAALAAGETCVKSMPIEAGGLIADQRTQRTSQAVYGEFYWTPMDNLKFTLGARYMDDRFHTASMQGLSDSAYTGGAACVTTAYETCYQQGATRTNSKDENSTYKAAVQYDYDQGMVYLSFVTGVRPEGAQPDATLYKAAESEQIEIGTRNIFFDGAMRLNVTAFRQEVENSQQSVIRFSSAYIEPHDMVHQGVQMNLQSFVTPSTIISLNALVTDSTFDTVAATAANTTASATVVADVTGYAFASGSTSLEPHNPTNAVTFETIARTTAATTSLGGSTTQDSALQDICSNFFGAAVCGTLSMYSKATDAEGNVAYLINAYGDVFAIADGAYNPAALGLGTYQKFVEIGGNKVPGTADLESTVTLTQLYQFGGGSGSLNLSYHYKDKTYGDIFNAERYSVDDTEYFNFNATYSPDNADWYVNLWARNLADKRYINSIARNSNLQGGSPFLTFDQGRKVGLDLGLDF
jgi:outer membrane receptor protein involved in Fe transport